MASGTAESAVAVPPPPAATAAPAPARPARWRVQEPVNCLSHLAGALLGLPALGALLHGAAGQPQRQLAFAIYGATLILVFASSAALHALHATSGRRRLLRRLDHAAIYFFIAGTNTPLCLVTLRDQLGGDALYLIWSLAIAGAVFKVCWLDAPPWLSTASYIGLSAVAAALVVPLLRSLAPAGFAWLLSGAACYGLGTLIYSLRRPNPLPGILGHHELWHFAVLAGSICHYLLMLEI